MTAGRAYRMTSKLLGGLGLLLGGACTTTSTALPAKSGTSSFKIECVRIEDCWAQARQDCKGKFHTVSKRDNTIPESELPGLNAQTQANSYRHTTSYGTTVPGGIPSYGPGIESDEPMPASEVVVECASGS